ncbi:MAG: DNA repair protein RadC [Anaerolineae bacterium]|nr:DNA repair protein RadC [Anaerolineae bacterium]
MENRTGTYRITDFSVSDRPRERLAALGAQALSNAELLAILLRVGIKGENAVQLGQRLLQKFGGLLGLHRAAFEDVCKEKGVGEAKAAQIKAAIELGRRMASISPEERPCVQSPADVVALVMYEMSALTQEHLWVMVLDTRNRLISIERLYKGSLNTSMVRVGELFKAAIKLDAASVVVIHNHPSGDPSPSPDDIVLTRAIAQAGKLLDIELVDHLVIGHGRYVSLKERGLGFS